MAAIDKTSNIKVTTVTSTLDVLDLRTITLPIERPELVEGFDPRKFRKPAEPIQPWMAYFNLLRASFGAGMLAIPMAISQSGIIVGPIIVTFIGFLLVHTHLMLLWCLNEVCRQLKIPIISYRYGFRMALLHGPPLLHDLGEKGPSVIAIFMVLSQVGICSIFVIFTGDNLRDIMDWNSLEPSLLLLYLPIILLELGMHNLTRISIVNVLATVLNVLALGIVVVQTLRGPFHEEYRATSPFPQGWVSLLVAIGIMLFNLSAVGVVLSCEKSLVDPTLMTRKYGATHVGIMMPTFLAIVFGPLGYSAFGVMEENILRYLPYDDLATMIAFGMFAVSVTLSYPLACYPATQIVIEVIKNHDPNITPDPDCLKGAEFVTRPIFITLTFFIAYLVPYQGPFVAFVGSLCTTLLSLVFPALMEISICYPSNFGRYKYILIKDLLIIVLGCVIWVGGVGLCGYLIYVRIHTGRSPTMVQSDDVHNIFPDNKSASFYFVKSPFLT